MTPSSEYRATLAGFGDPIWSVALNAERRGETADEPPEPFDLVAWPPGDGVDVTLLSTVGVSDHALSDKRRRIELVWVISGALDPEGLALAAPVLATVAVHAYNNDLRAGAVLHLGALPHFPNCNAIWLTRDLHVGQDMSFATSDGNHHVQVLRLVPLTDAECTVLEERGAEALIEHLETAEVDPFSPRS